DDGRKTVANMVRWIGQNLGVRGGAEIEAKVGAWGVDMLLKLAPLFALENDILVLPLTDDLDAYLNDVVERGIASNPRLSPRTSPPVPWPQLRRGKRKTRTAFLRRWQSTDSPPSGVSRNDV